MRHLCCVPFAEVSMFMGVPVTEVVLFIICFVCAGLFVFVSIRVIRVCADPCDRKMKAILWILIVECNRVCFLQLLKMHSTAKIRKISYEWHPAAFITPSHLPSFKLCTPDMQVAPAQICVCYVKSGIH